jgi:hypothetical protein
MLELYGSSYSEIENAMMLERQICWEGNKVTLLFYQIEP